MYCRNCGTNNAEGMPTCTACGNALTTNPYQATGQPGMSGPMGEKPKNYLVESILTTLCCCMPLGIAGIVFAAQVDSKWAGGDYAGAQESAANAKKFVLIGLVLGLVFGGIYMVINVLAAIGAAQGAGGGF